MACALIVLYSSCDDAQSYHTQKAEANVFAELLPNKRRSTQESTITAI